jgi:hypothetical protein
MIQSLSTATVLATYASFSIHAKRTLRPKSAYITTPLSFSFKASIATKMRHDPATLTRCHTILCRTTTSRFLWSTRFPIQDPRIAAESERKSA